MQSRSLDSFSPSFNSYSSGKLAEIAARVIQELSNGSENDSVSNFVSDQFQQKPIQEDDDEEEEEEFEFAVVSRGPEAWPILAGELSYIGQIREVYPLFNTDLLLDIDEPSKPAESPAKPVRLPLGKLFSQDRETTPSSSSESADIENLPADSYCVWTPNKAAKKSGSAGTNSKRWKIRELLYRSNSEGKGRYVFLSPAAKKSGERKNERQNQKEMVEKNYGKRGALKGSDKRRFSLPHKRDLVGIFSA